MTQAARNLFDNTNPLAPPPDGWPMQHAEGCTLMGVAVMGVAVILAPFVPLSIRLYRRAAHR